jgi:glycerol kinase
MNLQSGEWNEELCELFSVPIECLPKIVPTTGDFGTIDVQGKQITITASVCDQQASLYGHGCRKPGDVKITFGTGAFALAITGDSPVHSPEQGLLPTVAWQLQNRSTSYALDGGVYNAGAAINWAKSLGLFESFEQINQFSKHSAIERGLVFVPALSGLACPHWDRKAAGLWIGLSLDTGPMDMMQSVLEGIAFRAAEVIRAMEELTPIGKRISIDGGLSSNPYFCQFLANVLGKEIRVQEFAELTGIGAAWLASGCEGEQRMDEQAVRVYRADTDFSQFIDKFSLAIERSRQWH